MFESLLEASSNSVNMIANATKNLFKNKSKTKITNEQKMFNMLSTIMENDKFEFKYIPLNKIAYEIDKAFEMLSSKD